MISPPVGVEPVKAILSMPGGARVAAPVVGPSPGTTLITPAGTRPRAASSASRSAVSGRRRIGLEHDRAARRERRRELPGRHHQRVVPRHDLARDADRLLQRVVEQRAADRVRAAADRAQRGRVEAEVLGGAVRARPSPTRSPCRRCGSRARRAPCGSRRSRRRARAAAASARSAASSPTGRRAPPTRRRRRGRRRPRPPSRRAPSARRSPARPASRTSPDAGSTARRR